MSDAHGVKEEKSSPAGIAMEFQESCCSFRLRITIVQSFHHHSVTHPFFGRSAQYLKIPTSCLNKKIISSVLLNRFFCDFFCWTRYFFLYSAVCILGFPSVTL